MGKVLFLGYKNCSTAKKAQKWLDDHGIAYESRDLIEDNPKVAELKAWHKKSGLPLRRFFNTSGILYREQKVKAQLDAGMSEEDMYRLLATDGKMVKRPLVIGDDFVLVGFRQPEWEEKLL